MLSSPTFLFPNAFAPVKIRGPLDTQISFCHTHMKLRQNGRFGGQRPGRNLKDA
jgi:hypothetical protein